MELEANTSTSGAMRHASPNRTDSRTHLTRLEWRPYPRVTRGQKTRDPVTIAMRAPGAKWKAQSEPLWPSFWHLVAALSRSIYLDGYMNRASPAVYPEPGIFIDVVAPFCRGSRSQTDASAACQKCSRLFCRRYARKTEIRGVMWCALWRYIVWSVLCCFIAFNRNNLA